MFVCCQYPLWNFSFAAASVDLYTSVSHIILFMSRHKPREKSEDEDSDYYVVYSNEDNHLRQEYD